MNNDESLLKGNESLVETQKQRARRKLKQLWTSKQLQKQQLNRIHTNSLSYHDE